MSTAPYYDIAVIGGGIVGLATAMALGPAAGRRRGSLVVLEAEEEISRHQTGNNSGVIHSGLYYSPGSLKARTCTEGARRLYRFCQEHDVAHERCGKLVVAVTESELPALAELERRGRANGLEDLRSLTPEGIREFEPAVSGLAGLWVGDTGIVDYRGVAAAYAEEIRRAGGEVRTGARVRAVRRSGKERVLETEAGAFRCGLLINCGGLWADRLARLCGVDPEVVIVPFRGEYLEWVPGKPSLVRGLVYPVPDPRFPFLGVHFTRNIHGQVEAGPNAVLAFKRSGYSWTDLSLRDTWETLSYPGFQRLAWRYWRFGLGEVVRSLSRRACVRALRRLVPDLRVEDFQAGGAGVRAQALDRQGRLVDDFLILQSEGMIHVLNAVSPAATSSIAIGEHVAALAL